VTRMNGMPRIAWERVLRSADHLLQVAGRRIYLTALGGAQGAGTDAPGAERDGAGSPTSQTGAGVSKSAASLARRLVEASVRRVRERYPLDAAHDTERYHAWLRANGQEVRLPPESAALLEGSGAIVAPVKSPGSRPMFSVVVPVYRPPLWALSACLDSVLSQTLNDFELRVCDDAGGDPHVTDLLESYRSDPRVFVMSAPVNGGISGATNLALEGACGEYVAFLDHDDLLSPRALAEMARALTANELADVAYSDSDKVGPDGTRYSPSFKPGWSPEYLLSNMYLGHLLVIRRSLVEQVGGLRSTYDGSQDYDLALRCTELARGVVHVPEVLYHWRVSSVSAAANPLAKPWAYEAGRRALEDALARRARPALVSMPARMPGRYSIRPRAVETPVTLGLIATGRPVRDVLLRSSLKALENAAGVPCELVLALPAGPDRGFDADGARVVSSDSTSWGAAANLIMRAAHTDRVALVDPTCVPLERGWMTSLAEQIDRPGVGAAGGRLLEGRKVRHAGVVLGLEGLAGNVLRGLPSSRPGYLSLASALRDVTAVSGECIITTRQLVEEVGGFDEELPLGLCDVAYCLELGRRGLRVVFDPAAELRVLRPGARTPVSPTGHRAFAERFAQELAEGDPFYSIHLELEAPFCRLRLGDSAT
jgi:GT2 family glycosyltransferase